MPDIPIAAEPFLRLGRLQSQIAELLRLAGPVIVARAGIITMALADTVMVGRFATEELAYQAIAVAPLGPILIGSIGLLMGTLVMTAAAFGACRLTECGAVWRRSIPYALLIGLVGTLLCLLGEPFLLASGQSPELAAGGGAVILIIGLGVPAHLVWIASAFFLEGIKRPLPGMIIMIAGNLLNIALNWVLVYGHWGFPEMGAVGSAWATTAVRVFLALALVGYIWTMTDHARFAIRRRPGGGWCDWRPQRQLGYATAGSIGVESIAFMMVGLYAGWLGVQALAAFSITLNLIALVFMVALGFGAATAVQVGNAHGRGNHLDMALAGWTGLAVNSLAMVGLGVVFLLEPAELAGLYTSDPHLHGLVIPLIAIAASILVVDGGQGVMANALRGRGDTWVPTALHVLSYFGVMVPVCWVLAFPLGRGVVGIFEGILVASIIAVSLLAWRFWRLATRDAETC